jgi:hypothetical protein
MAEVLGNQISKRIKHIQPYYPLPRYNVVGTDTAIVAVMTEVGSSSCSSTLFQGRGDGLYEVYYENVSN